MKMSRANRHLIVYYLINALLALIICALIICILSYPYKKLVTGNVLVDVEVCLQKQDFSSLTKGQGSEYYFLSQPKGNLTIAPDNIWCYLLAVMKTQLLFIAGFIILYNLRSLVLNIRNGNSFVQNNYKTLRLWAAIIIIMPFLFALRTYLLNLYIPDNLVINGFKVIKPAAFEIQSILKGGITGSVLLVISDAFRQGSIIKEEADLTI
jgi:hypothetical protein